MNLKIIIFSRDEAKQHAMRVEYQHKSKVTEHPRAEGYYEGGGPPEWDYNKNLYFFQNR